MTINWGWLTFIVVVFILAVVLLVMCFCLFFDQALLTRRGTVYRVKSSKKQIALTFDDGPSPLWTPKILDELKKANIKATFFMIGHHVKKYPEIARRVIEEGHTIGNHGYAHSVMIYYTLPEIEEEIKYSEVVIKEATGVTTNIFRPPKAWLSKELKIKIKSMGYQIVLWSLNSKDWVSFNHKYIVKYITRHVKPGDILLFHDSGDVFKAEGGDRLQTVLAIPLLAETLKAKGYEFVSIREMLT
ncbi:MAG: hypothetical protein A2Z88_04135 [Omnitrophica WOR_2 bacterium GWA2_47_8]|nr:MAG: hypothetical protein A2Z88_04135 [Omnitrophica WOR_2 bacterium GWA2_47_8]